MAALTRFSSLSRVPLGTRMVSTSSKCISVSTSEWGANRAEPKPPDGRSQDLTH